MSGYSPENVSLYEVFRFCYQHFADPRCCPRRGPWRVVNLLEGYGSDNPDAKSQDIKQIMTDSGIIMLEGRRSLRKVPT